MKVVPFPTERLPDMAKPATIEVETVPLKVKLPPIAVMLADKTSVPLPESVRL